MDYIVLDLEWNQGNGGEAEVKELPFEIIDIGAIKLNHERQMTDEFNQLVRPSVYDRMHHITSKIIHLHMRDLRKGNPFTQVMGEFLAWCGEDYTFCTWGPADLTEMQRNLRYYQMPPVCDRPMRYLDVQKLFSIAYEDKKTRRSLEYAIDFLQISKDIPFHRAFSDAYYTAKILARLDEAVLAYYSFDTFTLPKTRTDEIHVDFDTYHKYISVEFADKMDALSDREVLSTHCFACEKKKNLKRKIKWFSSNGKHYYCVSLCPVHGFMKSKIRIKKSAEEGIYIVKTSKFISESEFQDVMEKKNRAKEQQRLKKWHIKDKSH